MIYQGSRYEGVELAPIADNRGVFHVALQYPLGWAVVSGYTVHRVEAGDRLDLLATSAYGDPEFWWRIAEANPQLAYPDELEPGTLLRIPTVVDEGLS